MNTHRRKPTNKWLGAVKPKKVLHRTWSNELSLAWSVEGLDRLWKDLSQEASVEPATEQEIIDFLFGDPAPAFEQDHQKQLVIAMEDLDQLLSQSPSEILSPLLEHVPMKDRADVEEQLTALLQELSQSSLAQPNPLTHDSIGRALERRRHDPSVTVVAGPSTRQ